MDLFKIVNLREEWDIIDRLALSGFQKDFASTLSTLYALEQSHIPLPDKILQEAISRIHTPGLREAVVRQQDFYVCEQQRPFDFQGSLKSNDIVAGLTDGNEILKRILAPYRGKVISHRYLGRMVQSV